MAKWHDNPVGDEEVGEHRDALPLGAVKGRGAGLNPGNRFETVRLHVLGEYLDEQANDPENPAGGGKLQVRTQVFRDDTRTILNYVDPKKSPDIGYRWSINPYRGCEHGCAYCYARPTHEMLGLSAGLDFETKIFAKTEAADLLRRELADPKWKPEFISISGVTDPYQPIEAKLRVTRGIMEVLAECRQPFGIVTKNHLVTRDIDLLKDLAAHHCVHVALSVTSLDKKLASKMEPRASSPSDRLRAIEQLAKAGVPTVAMIGPLIPGLTDTEMPAILKAAADAGAMGAGYVVLRLPWQVKTLFLDFLKRCVPERASHVETLLREMHDGQLYRSTYGIRQKGDGPIAEQIGKVFKVFAHRYGLDRKMPATSGASFRRPMLDGQLGLFS